MNLRWCAAVLLFTVSFSFSQGSKGIESPGPQKSSSTTVPDSTNNKTDSTKALSDSAGTKSPADFNASDNKNSPDKCGLQISCVPESAEVFVNYTKLGLTPFKIWGFQEGYYELSIQKKGWEGFKKVVFLKKGQLYSLELYLASRYGSLQVDSKPQGAAVLLNKEKKGITPLKLPDLKPGDYSLRLELAEFAPVDTLISISKGSNTIVNKILTTQKAVDSLRVIHHKRARNFRRCFFGATSLAFAAGGYYFNRKVNNRLEDEKSRLNSYNNLGQGTSSASFDAAWNSYTDAVEHTDVAKRRRNALYTFSAIFAAGFIISIPF